jgi:hypothetical protein
VQWIGGGVAETRAVPAPEIVARAALGWPRCAVRTLSEKGFLELVRSERSQKKAPDFATFMSSLYGIVEGVQLLLGWEICPPAVG